ncbi:hypothetical protein C1645_826514 [Glomus cerebriforme]|uniref:Uncharacterized protein n=1 Tax=Glomus cerebriforme TaxID=658196 RepID=A0A397SZL4_9GLOM|nr:hypothetical protein C1645_826514 [Glomus cerebriforme]
MTVGEMTVGEITVGVEGKGLEPIDTSDQVPKVITSLKNINTKNYYRISASHLTVISKEITWSQIEGQAMEKETLQVVEKALCEKIPAPSLKIFNKQILFDSKKNTIMEFDGIIIL